VIKKEQTIYMLGAILLLAGLYFGFDTKPTAQKTLEKSRVLNSQDFDRISVGKAAKETLKKDELEYVEALENQFEYADKDSTRVELLKQLSSFWFQKDQAIAAGIYAKEIAQKEQTAQSWAIAGTTFAAALKKPDLSDKDRVSARDQAVDAFEHAISLEPSVVEHRINQALCYIETPDQAQPMKGVQMLLTLATNYPESPLPSYHLARLAVQTGQYEKAETRIEQALKLDPKDGRFACLAIDIYTALNKADKAKPYTALCAQTK
jgi:tetratricopeptide (TPR) repeat protein